MKFWVLSLMMLTGAAQAADASYFAEPVSCTAGPYGLKLPGSYQGLREMGELREDRVLPGQIPRNPGAEQRELTFSGLRLTIMRKKLDPANYQVLSADLTRGSWKIGGPFRVGALLPAKVGDVDTRQLRGRGIVEFVGESSDVVRVYRNGRRISWLTYLCHID